MTTTVTVPVPPKPKKFDAATHPYYGFDLVAALHKDAAPEARALALLIVARELASFAQDLESLHPGSDTAMHLRKQAGTYMQTALGSMPG